MDPKPADVDVGYSNLADQSDPRGIQRMLDENVGLIRTIEEYRINGMPDLAAPLKRTLHRNLMHLAALADQEEEKKEGEELGGFLDALKYELFYKYEWKVGIV